MTTVSEEQTQQTPEATPHDEAQAPHDEAQVPHDEAHTEAAADEEGEAIHLPDPSIWPLVIATGVTILLAGIPLHLIIIVTGLAVLVFGIGGWLYQDIQVAKRDGHH
jgi:hypothetical protein